jgi:hypothetical protein
LEASQAADVMPADQQTALEKFALKAQAIALTSAQLLSRDL